VKTNGDSWSRSYRPRRSRIGQVTEPQYLIDTMTTIATISNPRGGRKRVMKRSVTLILCLVVFAVGLWVMSSSQTLDSACTLSARTGGGQACVSGMPFYLLGIALSATGVVSMIVALSTLIRSTSHKSTRRERSTISTLHPQEVESLRDVA
jgi:hypothetical protein